MRGGLSKRAGVRQRWLCGVLGRYGLVPEGLRRSVAVGQQPLGVNDTRCRGLGERLGEFVGALTGPRGF